MGAITTAGNSAFSDFNTINVPASGLKEVSKPEVRALFAEIDIALTSQVEGMVIGGSVVYATLAALTADLVHAAGVLGVVYNDSTAANNGIYVKSGVSGSGGWTITDLALPSTFVDDLADALDAAADAAGSATAAATSATAAAASATSSATHDASALSASVNAAASQVTASNAAASSVAASEASGSVLFYDTKAAANTALSGLSNLQIVEVMVDESLSSHRTRYRKESGVYVYKVDLTPTPDRERLTAARTYYVRTDGNNGNTGLANTSGGAFATIQKAVDVALGSIDRAGYSITISVGAGTFVGVVVAGNPIGAGSLTIIGAGPTTIISVTSGNALFASSNALVSVSNLKVQTATSGSGIVADSGAQIFCSGVTYGACADYHNLVNPGSFIFQGTNYTIAGAAIAHLHLPGGGRFTTGSITINLSTSIAWGNYFLGLRGNAYVDFHTTTFTGSSATGVRAVVHAGATLDLDGKTSEHLPGDNPMVVASGGTIFAAAPIFAVGQSKAPLTIQDGMFVEVNDSSGASAIIHFPLVPALTVKTPRIVWENVANTFVTSDPGAGANKWWVQPNGLFTNRFVGVNTLTMSPHTSTLVDIG